MSLSNEELAAIRERAEAAVNALPDGDGPELGALDRLVIQDVPRLLAEVERLRVELDASDRAILLCEDQMGRDEARLDKVRALREGDPCGHCHDILTDTLDGDSIDGSDQ